jgi:hypothetical protein
MKVSNPDELFKKEEHQEPPEPMDPISESKAAMLGQPIKAYKWQDQQSYITIESSTLAQLQADESQDHSKSMAILQEIIQERKAMQYVAQMEAKIGRPIADDPAQIPPEMQNQIAMIAAQKLLQEQQEQAEQNPPPIDPSKVLMEENRIKEKSNDAREALDARKLQLEEMKLTKEMQSMQHEQVLREMEQRNIQAKTEAEIEIQKMKMQAEIERLKLEQAKIQNAQQEAGAKLQLEERNANLQAETKAFDSTLRFEKESKTGVDRDENLTPQS